MNEQLIKSGRLSSQMTFHEKVWALTARIPKGKVTTYGRISQKLGTGAALAVGNALNKNPYAPQVPCHRVVGSDGSLTGFAAGLARKRALLKGEGVSFKRHKVDLSCVIDL